MADDVGELKPKPDPPPGFGGIDTGGPLPLHICQVAVMNDPSHGDPSAAATEEQLAEAPAEEEHHEEHHSRRKRR